MLPQPTIAERLSAIEELPLADRGAAYGEILAELQSALESADASR